MKSTLPPPTAGKSEQLYPIRTVAQLTQVNPITLRAWERRYNLVRPLRTPAGHRLYSEEDIRRIREIIDLSEQGIGLAQIAALLARQQSTASEPVADDQAHSPLENKGAPATQSSPGWRRQLEQAAQAMDESRLKQIEREALAWLQPNEAFETLLLPILEQLEQQRGLPEYELRFHWLSELLLARLHRLLSGTPQMPPQKNQLAVDTFGICRPYKTAEYRLILLLSTQFLIRLAPPTLDDHQTARLMTEWHVDGWLRLSDAPMTAGDVVAQITANGRACPGTIIIPCRPLRADQTEGDRPGASVGGLLQDTPTHCLSRIAERLVGSRQVAD